MQEATLALLRDMQELSRIHISVHIELTHGYIFVAGAEGTYAWESSYAEATEDKDYRKILSWIGFSHEDRFEICVNLV